MFQLNDLSFLNRKKIAITGGVASGKTTICNMMRQLGACVVSADAIVHELLARDAAVIQKVAELLGESVAPGGVVNRSTIAQRVFEEPANLDSLEEILHPPVFQEIEQRYEEWVTRSTSSTHSCFVAEVPLLFDSERCAFFDEILYIAAPKEFRRERARRSGMTYFDEREERLSAPRRRPARIDHAIDNRGTLQELEEQVLEWLKSLR